MASRSVERIALLSIRPQFAQSIMKGRKRIEFRKTRFLEQVSHVVVYATYPTKRIIGYFSVLDIDEDTPKNLWMRYKRSGGILYEEFKSYYRSCSRGVAIVVGEKRLLRNPMPLAEVKRSLNPPQSFVYLSRREFERIQRQT